MRILHIDDDRHLRESLADYFRWVENWEVYGASGPREALAELTAQAARFDVILLDIMMPPDETVEAAMTSNGFDTGLLLLEKVRAVCSPCPPVLILSGRQDLQFVVDTGDVAGYLRKTQTPEEIVEVIKSVGRGTR